MAELLHLTDKLVAPACTVLYPLPLFSLFFGRRKLQTGIGVGNDQTRDLQQRQRLHTNQLGLPALLCWNFFICFRKNQLGRLDVVEAIQYFADGV